jgi:hypothetical protein
MSSDGDGGEMMELQAYDIIKNGSRPCPSCKTMMNPVEFLYGKGVCPECLEKRNELRIKGRLA